MLPGPNEPYPEIMDELKNGVIPHYGDIWNEILPKTCEEMKAIFQTSKSDVVIWPMSGSSAHKFVASNIVGKGDKIISLNNGRFGELFEDKILTSGGEVVKVEADYGKAIELEQVIRAVDQNSDAKAIFVVHCETSSCLLNPIKEIGEVAEESDILYVVDAISSLGGTEVKMDDWNIDACMGYASKCLGSIGVLSPIAFNDKIWEIVKKRPHGSLPYFMDLKNWTSEERKTRPTINPVTMPTLNVVALRMAINLALKEGLDSRFRRHRIAAKATREGVRAMGLKVLPEEDVAADSVTGVLVPQGLDVKIRKMLEEEHNIMVGGNIGKYGKDILIRIGHMGLTASPEYVLPTLYALQSVLKKLGQKLPEGEALRAAGEIFKDRPEEWTKGLLTRYSRKYLTRIWD